MKVPNSTGPSLTIDRGQMRERLAALIKQIETVPEMREQFLLDPAGTLSEEVTGASAGRHQLSEVNRLMFAILANDELVKWIADFEPRRKHAAREAFVASFAKKVAELGDATVLGAILSNAAVGNGFPGVGPVAYQCVSNETTGKKSCTCTPVAKASLGREYGIDPATLRSLSEALVDRAKELARTGQLEQLNAII
ncbi:hypothetical protein [Aestuariivirga sp.]|uniref:hypothetical protein n=1 Tax=Aestuariivirga sp. TaxID=2650926 RepID=UPI0025BFB29E|nr:hypothetical protein [Aestuariivirga sp.]MCA3554163.1 hypothetical protein [Aestuariivirga sp.]